MNNININIGENIKKLRRKKDMTQESLAELLNVTTQAVSKWETGMCLPDIGLIAPLANIFDVSADLLLGIDVTAKERRIIEILEQMTAAIERENDDPNAIDEHIKILREGLQEFPNNYILLSRLASSFWNKIWHLKKINMQDEVNKYTEEAIKIYTHLLGDIHAENMPILEEKYGYTPESVRFGALNGLAYIYKYFLEDTQKAIEWANRLPTIHESRELVLSRILDGNEKFKQIWHNIGEYSRCLKWELEYLQSQDCKNDDVKQFYEILIKFEQHANKNILINI